VLGIGPTVQPGRCRVNIAESGPRGRQVGLFSFRDSTDPSRFQRINTLHLVSGMMTPPSKGMGSRARVMRLNAGAARILGPEVVLGQLE